MEQAISLLPSLIDSITVKDFKVFREYLFDIFNMDLKIEAAKPLLLRLSDYDPGLEFLPICEKYLQSNDFELVSITLIVVEAIFKNAPNREMRKFISDLIGNSVIERKIIDDVRNMYDEARRTDKTLKVNLKIFVDPKNISPVIKIIKSNKMTFSTHETKYFGTRLIVSSGDKEIYTVNDRVKILVKLIDKINSTKINTNYAIIITVLSPSILDKSIDIRADILFQVGQRGCEIQFSHR